MRTINIDLLDLRTLDKALKQIEQYQKRLRELIPEFLKACAETVRDMANNIISGLPYESDIISGLQNSWKTETTDDGQVVTLINNYDKAVYIEFGTGLVGKTKQHKEADEAGYQYDVNGHGAKGWRFIHSGDEPLDVPDRYYSDTKSINHTGMWFSVHTTGAPATMFLYQAATEFAERKVYERVWKEFASKRKL